MDLSAASGCGTVSEALLNAVLTASSTRCSSLDVSGHVSFSPARFVVAATSSPPLPPRVAPLSCDALCSQLRDRRVSLRVLNARRDCGVAPSSPPALYFSSPPHDKARFANIDAVLSLLAAAPRCEMLRVDVSEDAGEPRLPPLLRRAPPFASVALRRLAVGPPRGSEGDAPPAAPAGLWPAASLLRDIVAGPPLEQLEMHRARYSDAFAWSAAIDAFVESSISGGLTSLLLTQCRFGPTLAPLLARLLTGGRLRVLRVVYSPLPPLRELCSRAAVVATPHPVAAPHRPLP